MDHGNYIDMNKKIYIGTAGWNIPRTTKDYFPEEGTHLERYADVLQCVEINSTFYRDHQVKTFEKWASMTPDTFRFSVKLNQRFTHETEKFNPQELAQVLEGYTALGEKLGVMLLQFPGTLPFDPFFIENLLESIRQSYLGSIVIEPRNNSWKCPEALELMKDFNVSKVVADPEKCEFSKRNIDYGGVSYLRYHGQPVIYRSSYGDEVLKELKEKILHSPRDLWVIFDNTTMGHATENALKLMNMTVRPSLLS